MQSVTLAQVAQRNRRLNSPRLRELARRSSEPVEQTAATAEERCELCGEVLPGEHRHLVDIESRRLLCACRACATLLSHHAAGGGHYRLIPQRRLRLDGFELSDGAWDALGIPVDMAFFFHSSPAGRTLAFYPSPMGATESRLELDAWAQIASANPVLETMEPDVEALLVDRSKGTRRQWLVPIDDCYRLVAVIRTRWRGFSGGKEVWLEIERFFEQLHQTSERRSNGPDQARQA